MLRIESLVLYNFKSWYGEHIIKLNTPGLACIVGANGSGKSNIIDSLLFVFGWRAKQLRQDKLVDLIHSSEFKAEFAKVQVNFSNQGQTFSIGRIIQLSGHQHYELNNVKSTLDNITQQLLSNGLDIAHNRFLILQGEVESISMMKAVGDDVLSEMTQKEIENINIFQQLVQTLKLQFTPDNMYEQIQDLLEQNIPQQIKNKLSQIQPSTITIQSASGLLEFIEQIVGTHKFLPILCQKMAIAEYYNNQKLEIRTTLSGAVQYRDSLLQNKEDSLSKVQSVGLQLVEDLSKEMQIASQNRLNITQKQQNIQDIQIQELSLQKEIDNSQKEALSIQNCFDETQQLLEVTVKDLSQVTSDIKLNQIGINVIDEKQAQLLTEFNDSMITQKKIDQENQKLHQEHDVYPQQKQILQAQLQQNSELLQVKNVEIEEIQKADTLDQKQILQIQKQLQDLEVQILPISTQKTQFQSMQQSIVKQVDQKLSQFVDLTVQTIDQLIQLSVDLKYENKNSSQLREEINNLKQKQQQFDIKKIQKQKQEFTDQIQVYNQQLVDLNLKIKETNQQKLQFSTNNKLLSSLLEAQKSGQLSGIYGRLGSLGQIDSKLNIAAAAAFSSQLDYIVIDSMDQVQQCLSFIRKNNLGIASFIDLNQVRSRYSQYYKQFDNPAILSQNGGHLFLNLVQTQENFLPAFWHVMQETIVCESIDQALKLNKNNNKQKLRVVTLNGELFEKSGSLTGGGSGLANKYKGFRQDVQSNVNTVQIEKDIQNIEIQRNNLDSQLQLVLQNLNETELINQQIKTKTQDFTNQQYEVQRQQSKVNLKISKIISISESLVLKQYQSTLNSSIIQEILDLQSILNENQQVWQQSLYRQTVSSIIELTTYYEKQGISSSLQIEKYIAKHKNIFLLESDDSLIANIIQFPGEISSLFGLNETTKLQSDIDSLIQQEKIMQSQVSLKQEQLDKLGNTKQYKTLRNQIQQLQKQKADIEKQIQQLDLQFMKFEQLNLQYQLQTEENNNKIQLLNEQQTLLKSELDQINQVISQLTQYQKQLQEKKHDYQQQQITNDQNLSHFNLEHKFKKDKLSQITANKLSLHQQLQTSTDQILSAETNLTNLLKLISFLNDILSPLQEQLNYQQPLISSHENKSELTEYDNFIVANFQPSNSKKSPQISLNQLKSSLQQDLAILDEFIQRTQKMLTIQTQFQQISEHAENVINDLNTLKDQRQSDFMTAFNEINAKLREIYRIFSMGGDAVLELVNHFDPFEGIQFSVMPPKKAWRQIQNLSGGEKTLSSLSLIFALHQYKKNFIYVVDEIDAALDFRNVSLVANYLKEQTKECQFVIISLRNNTFEIADRLIGVYKVDNVSQTVSLDIE